MTQRRGELTVTLGGHPHFVDVSGLDVRDPAMGRTVVLLCHGGPGYSELPMVRAGAYAGVQGVATLVTWDQRGTARSFSDTLSPDTMSVQQLVSDTLELTAWVQQRFTVSRVHMIGHSAGGMLALLAAHQAPELFHTVFALSPHISIRRSAPLTYRTLLARAEEQQNARAVKELRELGPPPWPDLRRGVEVQAKWVAELDGLVFGGPDREAELFARFGAVPGYTEADYESARRGTEFSSQTLFEEAVAIDLFERVPEIEVPVAVGVGRHDLLNFSDVAANWLARVRAAQKQLYWFERSAHFPHFTEPEAFSSAVLSTIGVPR